jgi:DNA-binding MarR family transcriptional regulator
MPGETGLSSTGPPPAPDIGPLEQLRNLDRLVHEPARLVLLACLLVAETADFVLLATQTGLTFGNLSSHVAKLERAGYVEVEKSFQGKRPRTRLRLTERGCTAFGEYRDRIQRALGDLARNPGLHDPG